MPINSDVQLGIGVKIPYPKLVNLYGCILEENVFIGPFVEIQKGAHVGKNSRVSSHSFICEGVTIGENVFVAHGVMFINDLFDSPSLGAWNLKKTTVGNNVQIGSNVTILPVVIGEHAVIGAGAVVTRDIPAWAIVVGNPARVVRIRKKWIQTKPYH